MPSQFHDDSFVSGISSHCARFIEALFPQSGVTTVARGSPLPLDESISYTLRRTQLPFTVAHCALLLLQRLRTRYPRAAPVSTYALFLTAFMIASKVVCDETYSNKSWSIVSRGQFTLSQLNKMEREMCGYLEWQIDPSHRAIRNFEIALRRAFSASTSDGAASLSQEHAGLLAHSASTSYEFMSLRMESSGDDDFPPTPPLSPSLPTPCPSVGAQLVSPPDTPPLPTPTDDTTFDNDVLVKIPAFRPASVLWNPTHEDPEDHEDGSSSLNAGLFDDIVPNDHTHDSLPYYMTYSSTLLPHHALPLPIIDRATFAPRIPLIPLPFVLPIEQPEEGC